jgi:predicted lysophospholipase L1 biosynthesis ABC-type transport system permease subunit
MLKLGFNVVILPKDQNLSDWYSEDFATKYMPEDYVNKLANSGIITVRHFLPSLQQKIDWREYKRTIILVGTRGEVPNLHKDPKKPLVQPVPKGTITLGYELHRSLGLNIGDKIKLMGREFEVQTCYQERGNKDDITAWIHLTEAQELLNKSGLINAILALECLCTGSDVLPRIRKEIAEILPGTQVIERGSRAIARSEARFKVQQEAKIALEQEKQNRWDLKAVREKFAAILTPLVIFAAAIWIVILGFMNVNTRREEVGILRTFGVKARNIFLLFLTKHIFMGILGGLFGFVVGIISAGYFGKILEEMPFQIMALISFEPYLLVLSIGGAIALAVLAGWIPTMVATHQDPAVVLRDG